MYSPSTNPTYFKSVAWVMGYGHSLALHVRLCVRASAQVDMLGVVQLEFTDGQARAVEQLQSLLRESTLQKERLRAELCSRRPQVCCALAPAVVPSYLKVELWPAWHHAFVADDPSGYDASRITGSTDHLWLTVKGAP